MTNWLRPAALFLLMCVTAAAQSNPPPSAPPPAAQPAIDISGGASNPNPPRAARAGVQVAPISAPSGYQLSNNDSIGVEVFGEDDLKTAARLNSEGNVSLPLIGTVHLGGLTVTQATARITELYAKDYLVSPRVNVLLLGYAKRRFTVLGQVNRPGSYEMPETNPGGIDLLEAIAMAGGYTRIAAPERVTVRRHTDGGGDEVLKVNAKRLERGDARAGAFKVQPGDTITVGESLF